MKLLGTVLAVAVAAFTPARADGGSGGAGEPPQLKERARIHSARAEDAQAVASLRDAESAIVELVSIPTRTTGARTRHGSAFYVSSQGHLLTCFHVLDRMPRENAPRLLLPDGREQRFEVMDVDRETDLALLLSDPPERFLLLADALLPDVGQRALFGATPFTRCTVVGVGTRRAMRNVKVDRFADPGDSGGPLLAETTLAVIGVMRANLESATGGVTGRDRRGHGVAVPLIYVRPFLRSAGAVP